MYFANGIIGIIYIEDKLQNMKSGIHDASKVCLLDDSRNVLLNVPE